MTSLKKFMIKYNLIFNLDTIKVECKTAYSIYLLNLSNIMQLNDICRNQNQGNWW